MQQKNTKVLIIPLISLSIFIILIFGAAYAFYIANTSMNVANYQVVLPKATSLMCTKQDCGVTVTPAQMSTSNTDSTNAAATSTCYLNCTCSGTQGAKCNYNVTLIEVGTPYTPSPNLNGNREFTAQLNLTSATGCSVQNTSTTETQVNTIKDKIVTNCSLTVPAGGSVSANVRADFKFYNPNIDQASQAGKSYTYQLTTESNVETVTFDANGGTVGTTSKTVIYGGEYGELPTPTWSGHTFRGWNGKNKFNKDASSYAGIQNETSISIWAGTVLNNAWVLKNLKASTTYRASYRVYCLGVPEYDSQYANNLGFLIYSGVSGYSATSSFYAGRYINAGEEIKVSTNFTTPAALLDTAANYRLLGYTNRYLKNNAGVMATVIFSDIQIEEGTVETLYEPYYVTETTKVTQAKDHTLKAIWD